MKLYFCASSLLSFFFSLSTTIFAQSDTAQNKKSSVSFEKFHPWYLVKNSANNTSSILKTISQDWSVYDHSKIVIPTAILWYYDEPILSSSRRLAYDLHIMKPSDSGQEVQDIWTFSPNSSKKSFSFGIKAPKSTNAFFWFFGEGISALALSGAFLVYGSYLEESYEVETASLLLEGLITTGFFVFPLKVMTGRESPARSSAKRGKWHFYPGLSNYLADQSKYYAFPSGHTATLVSCMTILAQRYPHYTWLPAIGSAMSALLMFSLLNNKTHWASDFPLAIAIGYLAGSETVKRSFLQKDKQNTEYFAFYPFAAEKGYGLTAKWEF